MAVIINEVEHIAADEAPVPPGKRPRTAPAQPSPEAMRLLLTAAARLEATRLARVWAD